MSSNEAAAENTCKQSTVNSTKKMDSPHKVLGVKSNHADSLWAVKVATTMISDKEELNVTVTYLEKCWGKLAWNWYFWTPVLQLSYFTISVSFEKRISLNNTLYCFPI